MDPFGIFFGQNLITSIQMAYIFPLFLQ